MSFKLWLSLEALKRWWNVVVAFELPHAGPLNLKLAVWSCLAADI